MMDHIVSDYHIHTNISPDSNAEWDEVCCAAISKQLKEISITNHFEFFEWTAGGARQPDWSRPERALAEIQSCRKKYGKQLTIRYGVEIGQPHLFPELTRRLLETGPFDFVIASLHRLDGRDLSEYQYHAEEIAALSGQYLEEVEQMIEVCDFDCLGHFDLMARYAARSGVAVNLLELHRDKCQQIFRRLVERNAGIEINTSSLRQGLERTMPGAALLEQYRDAGGEWVTIGSDAHRACDVGAGFEEALRTVRTAGIHKLALFHSRRKHFLEI